MYLPELNVPTKGEVERTDKTRRAMGVRRDIERIVDVLRDGTGGELRELHKERIKW